MVVSVKENILLLNIPQQHIQQGEQYFPLGELFCTCYGHREIKLKEGKEKKKD